MATSALAQRRLFALRETIARIENADGPGLTRRKRRWQWDTQESPGEAPPYPNPAKQMVSTPFSMATYRPAVSSRSATRRPAMRGLRPVSPWPWPCFGRTGPRRGEDATLWIGQAMAFSEAGTPYGPGLKKHGLDPTRVLLARPRTIADALWMAETALGVPAFSTVILEIRGNPAGFGLTESRRLQLRARANGTLLLLLRQAGEEEASSALYRLRIDPAPAGERPLPDGTTLDGSIANPVFLVTPEKSKTADPVGILLEWNSHDRRFYRLKPRPAVSQEERRPADPLPVVSLPARRSRGAAALGEVVAFKGAS